MAFDPCGTRKLEGEDIIARLAIYLDVNPVALKQILKELADAANKYLNDRTVENK